MLNNMVLEAESRRRVCETYGRTQSEHSLPRGNFGTYRHDCVMERTPKTWIQEFDNGKSLPVAVRYRKGQIVLCIRKFHR